VSVRGLCGLLATRRRLRAGYRGALRQRERELEAKAARAMAEAKALAASARAAAEIEVRKADARAASLAKEVARLSLEWGPYKFGTRFTLYARFAESFVLQSRDLKEHGPYVLQVLCAMLQREMAQLDFTRAQPVAWENDEHGRPYYPVYRIEPWKEGAR